MRALAHIDFTSLVDIGGAEGYKSALARELFGSRVVSCDLSHEACERASQIYGIESRQVDGHELPFANEAFDVALCSETLEHVPDIRTATSELLRVARKAVVITVPREPQHVIDRNIRERVPHAHIHALTENSFDWVRSHGCEVHVSFALSPMTRVPMVLADGQPIRGRNEQRPTVRAFNAITPALQLAFGRRACASLVDIDLRLARPGSALDMVFTIYKPGFSGRATARRTVRAIDVMQFEVPHHYPHSTPNEQ